MAFDPSQIPGLTLAWRPDQGVTFDGSGNMTVAGAFGTTVSLTGLVATQPTISARLGPGDQYGLPPQDMFAFNAAGTLFGNFSATTFSSFTFVGVIGHQNAGPQNLLTRSTASAPIVQIPNTDNGVIFRVSTALTSKTANFAGSVKTGSLPRLLVFTYDATANQIQAFLDNVGGTAVVDAINLTGSMTFDQLGGSANSWQGLFGPLLMYNSVLNSANLGNLFGYFQGWLAKILYVANAGSDSSISPWKQATPYQTIGSGALPFNLALPPPVTIIAPKGGDIFRETASIQPAAAGNPTTIDGSLWGASRGSGMTFQNQGALKKAELRWSSAPPLSVVTGTLYSSGTLLTPAAGTTQFNHYPGNVMYVVPGGTIRFGSAYANPNHYIGAPAASKCMSYLPQYSCNVLRLFRAGVFQVLGAANNGAGKVRLTLDSSAGISTGNLVFIANVGGTTEANSAAETSAGMQAATVVDGTHVDLLGVTFTHPFTAAGWGYNAQTQATPAPGFFGHDTAGVGGVVNTLYVNAGMPLQTGDLEVPINLFPEIRIVNDGWTLNNIVDVFGWQGGPNLNGTGQTTFFNNYESYFHSGGDNLDGDGAAVTQMANAILGWAGSGTQYKQGPGDNAAFHGTSVGNISNSLCLYGDASNGHDLADSAFGTFQNNICIGWYPVRTQLIAGSTNNGVQTAINNLIILDNHPDGSVDARPFAIHNESVSPNHTQNSYFNTIVSVNRGAAGSIGISRSTAAPTMNVKNNEIYGFATALFSSAGNWSGDYNGYFNNSVNVAGGISAGMHDVARDPLFKNIVTPGSIEDFRPLAGSPLRGTAVAMSAIIIDLSALPRASPPTIGALEASLVGLGGSSGIAHGTTYERGERDDEEEAAALLLT